MLSPSDFNNAVPQFTNGNYASNPINPQYIAEPDAESYNRGTEPLQTLPAQWWNWFVNKFTARFNKVNIYVKNIFNELAQVLSIFNITPDGTEQTPTTSQLKTVFETCYPQYVKTQTTGTAVGCIPTVGTALGTTNNNILVTDSTGKLKPSGITVGTAAGCDATLFARKTEVDALYGNVVGTPLGTAAVGTCTTFARSDHVHPDTDIMKGKLICGYYGVMINGSDGFGCPGIHASAFLRSPYYGFIPYCGDPTNGVGCVGTDGWPFEQMHAKTFYGGICASASDSAYLYGPIYISGGVTAYSEPGGDFVLGMDAYDLGGRVHYTNAEQQAVGMLWVGGYYGSPTETKKYSAMRFWWCGQSGTPDWIWGTSNDCTKAFVYSPSCLSVGYATNACNVTGTVGIANGGTGATTAADGLNNLIAGMPSYNQALTGDACVMLLCSSTRIPGQFQANWTPINCFMQHVAVACAANLVGEHHGQEGLVCWSRSENTHIWSVTANSSDTIECDIFKALLCASNGDYRNITGNLNKIASIFGSFTVSCCTADCFFEADYMCITNDGIYIMNCDRNLTERKWNLNTQDPRPFTIGGAFFNFY